MRNLSKVFLIKIVLTATVWCVPLLLSPLSLLRYLGFDLASPEIFIRLLGMAYGALLVGYVFGLRAASSGIYPAGPVWVGIVSNGGAFLLLCIAAVQGSWASWGAVARMVMWGSVIGTGLITFSLVLLGPCAGDGPCIGTSKEP